MTPAQIGLQATAFLITFGAALGLSVSVCLAGLGAGVGYLLGLRADRKEQ